MKIFHGTENLGRDGEQSIVHSKSIDGAKRAVQEWSRENGSGTIVWDEEWTGKDTPMLFGRSVVKRSGAYGDDITTFSWIIEEIDLVD